MDSVFLLLAIAAASLIIGILMTWLLMRDRIDAAVERAKIEGTAERATVNERLRAMEAERLQFNRDQEALKTQGSEWRNALDLARDERGW